MSKMATWYVIGGQILFSRKAHPHHIPKSKFTIYVVKYLILTIDEVICRLIGKGAVLDIIHC